MNRAAIWSNSCRLKLTFTEAMEAILTKEIGNHLVRIHYRHVADIKKQLILKGVKAIQAKEFGNESL
jgi:hypothetical protein